jgi:ribosomal protein S27AE
VRTSIAVYSRAFWIIALFSIEHPAATGHPEFDPKVLPEARAPGPRPAPLVCSAAQTGAAGRVTLLRHPQEPDVSTARDSAPLASPIHATAVLLEDEHGRVRSAMCPLCRTSSAVAVEAGDAWRCGRCGQPWDSRRLGAVALFEQWAALRMTTDAAR